jgi:alkaline phosphatase
MEAMPFYGEAGTAPANHILVTDSAAAATAMATGIKVNNGVISRHWDGRRWVHVETILEMAQARGMAVGLVTTVPIGHATPAAFAAHVPIRTMMPEIVDQMLAHQVDVLLGGGEDDFLPQQVSGCYPHAGKRGDGRNLIAEAMAAGYTYVCDAPAFDAVDPASSPKLLGLFADDGMTRPFAPTLAAMTETAIEILAQDPDGFFLMVEGGQIDWAAHNNDAEHVIQDTLGLDAAVAVVKGFTTARLNTLVIVTADHETGGMQVSTTTRGTPDEDGPFTMPDGTPFYVTWRSKHHTSQDVPVTALGPWAGLLTGRYENTHIYDVMALMLKRWRVYLPVVLRT